MHVNNTYAQLNKHCSQCVKQTIQIKCVPMSKIWYILQLFCPSHDLSVSFHLNYFARFLCFLLTEVEKMSSDEDDLTNSQPTTFQHSTNTVTPSISGSRTNKYNLFTYLSYIYKICSSIQYHWITTFINQLQCNQKAQTVYAFLAYMAICGKSDRE